MPRRFIAPVALAASVAAGGVAGALVGVPAVSGAQEDSTATTDTTVAETAPEGHPGRRGALLESAAEALGMEPADLAAALRGGRTVAEVAQEQGVDVNTVIDAIVADVVEATGRPEDEVREHVTRFVEEGPRERGRFRHFAGQGLRAAAEAIGIEPSELVAALREGRTIAEVAQEHGVAVDTVVDAMVAEARERIERFVQEGRPERPGAPAEAD